MSKIEKSAIDEFHTLSVNAQSELVKYRREIAEFRKKPNRADWYHQETKLQSLVLSAKNLADECRKRFVIHNSEGAQNG